MEAISSSSFNGSVKEKEKYKQKNIVAGEKSALLVVNWPFFGPCCPLGVVECVPEVGRLQEDHIVT